MCVLLFSHVFPYLIFFSADCKSICCCMFLSVSWYAYVFYQLFLVSHSELSWWNIHNDSVKSITYNSYLPWYFSNIIVSLDIAFSCWNIVKLLPVLFSTKRSGFLPCRPTVSSSIFTFSSLHRLQTYFSSTALGPNTLISVIVNLTEIPFQWLRV